MYKAYSNFLLEYCDLDLIFLLNGFMIWVLFGLRKSEKKVLFMFLIEIEIKFHLK